MNKRFEFPFKENYKNINGVKLHYIGEGEGPAIWMMHGMPMWSYVYRKLIPPLVNAGYRCFAPDLMGFGLSDKPNSEQAHMIQFHVELMTKLIEKLELKNICIIAQDWGGPIEMRYAIENQNNISSIVLLNTFIERFPKNNRERKKENIITGPLPKVYQLLFKNGRFSSLLVNRLDVFRQFVWLKWKTGNSSKALGAGFRRPVDPRVMEQYRLPNDSADSRAGIAAFAKQIPNHAKHENTAYIDEIRQTLENWNIPASVIFPDGDMAWKPEEGEMIANVMPNARFHLIKNAGHYLQEDAANEVATLILNFLKTSNQLSLQQVNTNKKII